MTAPLTEAELQAIEARAKQRYGLLMNPVQAEDIQQAWIDRERLVASLRASRDEAARWREKYVGASEQAGVLMIRAQDAEAEAARLREALKCSESEFGHRCSRCDWEVGALVDDAFARAHEVKP